MSALVFSGAGQFAALPLWPQGGPVVILSTLALSLRFALITTSLAPLLAARPRWLRAALAYCVDPPTSRPSATHWSWLSSPASAI
jgi:predicted branched-subunit amino acid permease